MLLAALLLAGWGSVIAQRSPAPVATSDISVYFSPDGGAADAVIAEVNAARNEIKVMAYGFTHPEIAQALTKAHDRRVKVSILLDDSNERDQYTVATYLTNHGLPVLIDSRHGIMHNKVMIIDGRTVITGSMNFTKAGDESNAENVLMIRRPDIAGKYLANFAEHEKHARVYARRS